MEVSHGGSQPSADYGYAVGLSIQPENVVSSSLAGQDLAPDQDDTSALVPAGRHSAVKGGRPLDGHARLGADGVDALAGGIGAQIRTMARRLSEHLSQPPDPQVVPPSAMPADPEGFVVDEVTVTFGITAKATSSQLLAVLVELGGEATIEVALTLKRLPTDPTALTS